MLITVIYHRKLQQQQQLQQRILKLVAVSVTTITQIATLGRLMIMDQVSAIQQILIKPIQ
jgi:hypothetical protein